jgi:Holliday junction resolvase
MNEQNIQSSIIKWLESQGWLTVKTVVMSKAGFPDIIAIKDGKSVWIEVKAQRGVVSKLQLLRIKQLNDKGAIAFVAYSLDDVKEKLNEY